MGDDVFCYSDSYVNLVTPNQLEFELSTGHRASTLDSVLAQLLIAGVH